MIDNPNNKPQGEEVDFENSTVFSNPADYGIKEPKAGKHGLRRAAVVVSVLLAAAAVFAGWFFIDKFLPDIGNQQPTSSGTPSGTKVSILGLDYNDARSVTISTKDKKVELLNVSALEGEDKVNTIDKWILKGYDPAVTSGNIAQYRAEDACGLVALRTLPAGQDYGLDAPEKTITILMQDGAEHTIKIGRESPDKSGFYCSVDSKPDEVYLVETSALSLLEADPLHYADKTVISPLSLSEVGDSYFQGENSSLNIFDSIKISGEALAGEISLGMTTDKTKYNLYSLTSPIKAFASETKVIELLAPLSEGLTVSEAVSYDFQADKAKFGLDKPAYVAEYKIGSHSQVIRVSKGSAEGRCYVAVGAEPLAIYHTYVTNLPFQDLEVTGLYTPYPFFENITTVKQISLKGEKGDYTFDLTHIADAKEGEENLKVVCGENSVDVKSFRYFYQHLVKLSAISFTTEESSAKADVTINVKFLEEDSEDITLTFAKLSDMRYYLAVNGTPYGIVANKDIDTLFADSATLVSGGTINS